MVVWKNKVDNRRLDLSSAGNVENLPEYELYETTRRVSIVHLHRVNRVEVELMAMVVVMMHDQWIVFALKL